MNSSHDGSSGDRRVLAWSNICVEPDVVLHAGFECVGHVNNFAMCCEEPAIVVITVYVMAMQCDNAYPIETYRTPAITTVLCYLFRVRGIIR